MPVSDVEMFGEVDEGTMREAEPGADLQSVSSSRRRPAGKPGQHLHPGAKDLSRGQVSVMSDDLRSGSKLKKRVGGRV